MPKVKKTTEEKIQSAIKYLMEEHSAEWAECYGERGYSDPARGVILANWNDIPRGLADWLESIGYSLEWSDEWAITYHGAQSKAWRTSPDSYSWQSSIVLTHDGEWLTPDDGAQCVIEECAINAPGQSARTVPHWVTADDLSAAGFEIVTPDGEAGYFPGQDSNPETMARDAFKNGAHRVIFRLSESSQFYVRFEMWADFESLEWTDPTSGRFSISIRWDDAKSASEPGRAADPHVDSLLMKPYIKGQLAKISPDMIRAHLQECGAWDDDELADDAANQRRIVWMAACDLREEWEM